jgi:hypothetical protein
LAAVKMQKLTNKTFIPFQLIPRSDEDETYWKVKEETIDGVCEAVYQVIQHFSTIV